MNYIVIESFANQLVHLTNELSQIQHQIQEVASDHANGKKLKGNEIVAWLEEIYVKILFEGLLADEREEHDVHCEDGKRISVKTRKGLKAWNRTSGIPRIQGDGIPTHLAFVHLFDSYALDRIWLFPWDDLLEKNRFHRKNVRGNQLDYYFMLNNRNDVQYVVYPS